MLKKARQILPDGAIAVGVGLGVMGLCVYIFLGLVSRHFDSDVADRFGSMWNLTFVVVPGLFLPVEQELGRALAARRVRGQGSGPLIRRASILGGVLALIAVVGVIATAPLSIDELFGGNAGLVGALIVGLLGYVFAYIVRGTLAGQGRFLSYGILLACEGGVRVVGAIVLVASGTESLFAWGLMVGLSPAVGALIALAREKNLVTPGPDAPYSELSASLGWLLAGSLLAQLLLNVPFLAVEILADKPSEYQLAAAMFFALIFSRIPLFMFQAVQAVFLPKLAAMAASNQQNEFRVLLYRLLGFVALIGIVGVLGTAILGGQLFEKMFDRHLPTNQLVLLAAGNAMFMFALAAAQAVIALGELKRAVFSWALGVICFFIALVVVDDLLLRAEIGLLFGATASAIAMVVQSQLGMKRHANISADALVETAAPGHEMIDPS